MSNFANFANILPDPANYISDAGSAISGDTGAVYGPGFASVKFTSDAPTMVGKTNSGRLISRRVADIGIEVFRKAEKSLLLQVLDQQWKDHLNSLEQLRQSIGLRAYGQKDPLNEYKRESFNLFEEMKIAIKKAIVENIFTIQLYTQEEIEDLQRRHQEELDAQLEAHRQSQMNESGEARKPITRSKNKVKRNDPCPCGSGKKFKHCCGKL